MCNENSETFAFSKKKSCTKGHTKFLKLKRYYPNGSPRFRSRGVLLIFTRNQQCRKMGRAYSILQCNVLYKSGNRNITFLTQYGQTYSQNRQS